MKRLVLTGFVLGALIAPGLAKEDYKSLSKTWEGLRQDIERKRGKEADRVKTEKEFFQVTPKLHKANQQKAVKLLLDKGLGSRSRVVVNASLRALEATDDKRAVRVLIKTYGSAKVLGRKMRLAKILAALPSNEVHAPLVKALRDSKPWVRISAVAALGERGAKAKGDAQRPLEKLVKRDASLMVRAAAADALEQIGVDRPKSLPPAKADASGLPDRFHADRVAFLLDATSPAGEAAFQDPFAEEEDEEKGKEGKKTPKAPKKKSKKGEDESTVFSPFQLMTRQVLASVKRMDRAATRFTAARFGGQVRFYEREFLKPNRKALEGLQTWGQTKAGRDQNRDVARAIRSMLELDPPPQVIYLFLTGPAVARGRASTEEALNAIGELVGETPVRIHVTWFAILPAREPTSELGKTRQREQDRVYSSFVGELAKVGGGNTTQIDLARATAEMAKPDDKGGKAKKLDIDMTKALSSRDATRLKKALRIRKGQSDKAEALELVEQLGACPDARKATPLALAELRGEDPELAEAALSGFLRNPNAKVHGELLKALKSERDAAKKVRLLKAIAKHPGAAITSALIDMTGSAKARDLDRVTWRVLSERPTPELSNAKAKLTRKARGAPAGLAAFYANTASAKAAGRQPPSSSGLETGPDRFLPARFNAKGVAFVVDTNHDMKRPFWKPTVVVKPAQPDKAGKKGRKKKPRKKKKDKKKKGEAEPTVEEPVSSLEAVGKELERALRAAAKGGVSANVLLTGGRSWKSSCSPLGRGGLEDAVKWVKTVRAGGQRDVWKGLQRALEDTSCERIYLIVSGLPVRSLGANGKVDELLRKVRELNAPRDIEIHVCYVLPPVSPDNEELEASRRDLLAGMDALYKPLATASGGKVVIRHKLTGLGQPAKPAKPAK